MSFVSVSMLLWPSFAYTLKVNWTSPAGEQLTHGELSLTSDSRIDAILSSKRWYLRISNVALTDSGKYTCFANNSAEHVVELIVTGDYAYYFYKVYNFNHDINNASATIFYLEIF